jgi:hypothetical protein
MIGVRLRRGSGAWKRNLGHGLWPRVTTRIDGCSGATKIELLDRYHSKDTKMNVNFKFRGRIKQTASRHGMPKPTEVARQVC